MKKIVCCTFFAPLILTVMYIRNSPEDKMTSFRWLIGSWKMETSKGAIMETWIAVNDSTLAGESYMVKTTGGTQQLENVELGYRNKNYYYMPVALGQNNDQRVRFKITSYNDKEFIAENPEHDFPKRIGYQQVNTDSMHAFIDGGINMPDKRSNYHYSRYKN